MKEIITMSNQNEVKYVPTGTGPQYWGPEVKVTFLVTGAQSGEACFIFEGITPPGGGPPPHMHRNQEESFYLLEGALTIEGAGHAFQALPGDFIHIPRGTVHSFRNHGKADARLLTTVSPAGPAGLEKFFKEAFYPVTERSAALPPITQELMERVKAAAGKNDVEFARAA